MKKSKALLFLIFLLNTFSALANDCTIDSQELNKKRILHIKQAIASYNDELFRALYLIYMDNGITIEKTDVISGYLQLPEMTSDSVKVFTTSQSQKSYEIGISQVIEKRATLISIPGQVIVRDPQGKVREFNLIYPQYSETYGGELEKPRNISAFLRYSEYSFKKTGTKKNVFEDEIIEVNECEQSPMTISIIKKFTSDGKAIAESALANISTLDRSEAFDNFSESFRFQLNSNGKVFDNIQQIKQYKTEHVWDVNTSVVAKKLK